LLLSHRPIIINWKISNLAICVYLNSEIFEKILNFFIRRTVRTQWTVAFVKIDINLRILGKFSIITQVHFIILSKISTNKRHSIPWLKKVNVNLFIPKIILRAPLNGNSTHCSIWAIFEVENLLLKVYICIWK